MKTNITAAREAQHLLDKYLQLARHVRDNDVKLKGDIQILMDKWEAMTDQERRQDPKYPEGSAHWWKTTTEWLIKKQIDEMKQLGAQLIAVLAGFTSEVDDQPGTWFN